MPESNDDLKTAQLLARVDERTRAIQNDIEHLRDDIKIQNNLIRKQVEEIEIRINVMEKYIEEKYVKKDEFRWVQRIVYGMVGLILFVVFSAIISSYIGIANNPVK